MFQTLLAHPLLIAAILLTQSLALAGVRLPIHNLRDQGDTAHCWAYAMGHALESRSLFRGEADVLMNTEKDVKYWVDYERMMYIYRTKKPFYIGEYEGGWQIEYWETLLKHGKPVLRTLNRPAEVRYEPFTRYDRGLPFTLVPRTGPGGRSFYEASEKLAGTTFKNDAEAISYVIEFLNDYYGKPELTTRWFDQEIPMKESARRLLGSDYASHSTVDAMILVKPVDDGEHGWVRYLEERYMGYRYDQSKVLDLVKTSLNRGWPVTFDNVYHAMTIIGYDTDASGVDFYAIADSDPVHIRWVDAEEMLMNLNLVTFFREGIAGEIPSAMPASSRGGLGARFKSRGINIDRHDNVTIPPR